MRDFSFVSWSDRTVPGRVRTRKEQLSSARQKHWQPVETGDEVPLDKIIKGPAGTI
jgi:hypothetical protein